MFARSSLVRCGLLLVLLGGLADLVFHGAPSTLLAQLGPWLGADGQHAHLLTLLGMLVAVAGLVLSGTSHFSMRSSSHRKD